MSILLFLLCFLITSETLSRTSQMSRSPFLPLLGILCSVVLPFTGMLEGGGPYATDAFVHAVQVMVLLGAVLATSVYQLSELTASSNQ